MQIHTNVKITLFILCNIIALTIGILAGIRVFKQRDVERSQRDAEYSQQIGIATERNRMVSERLGELAELLGEGFDVVTTGLSSISAELGSSSADLRVLAERQFRLAEKAKSLEDYNLYLSRSFSSFTDWYYEYLDNEIEQELGIIIPRIHDEPD